MTIPPLDSFESEMIRKWRNEARGYYERAIYERDSSRSFGNSFPNSPFRWDAYTYWMGQSTQLYGLARGLLLTPSEE